ncbi:cupin domain-containing protein [Pedobacter sp. MR2016-24]|uniref:cupin domain-containing protein n=1 Tax=Pedobacter sp. MR2016-24 TaxID=2994466 RepID=UPI00224597F5|nr:cupin domain-containing protein [Pedobacter sp. MR2016-24]MCX2483636.1 cupin domain-containing protein [Pedobacter sp. MR2016-24]
MLQSELFQIAATTDWQDLGDGIQRQVFGYDNRVMMVKVKFEKGAIGQLHEHHHTQISYVESGVFETTIGENKHTLVTGDGFYVPPHAVHGVICLEPGILIDVFSPHREDFI